MKVIARKAGDYIVQVSNRELMMIVFGQNAFDKDLKLERESLEDKLSYTEDDVEIKISESFFKIQNVYNNEFISGYDGIKTKLEQLIKELSPVEIYINKISKNNEQVKNG